MNLQLKRSRICSLSRVNKPSHDWHVQPVVKDQNRSPPERCVSVEPAIHSDSVSSKLVHLLRSSLTRRGEPFKLTAAVHNVSTESRIKCVINADSLHFIVCHSERSEESLLFPECLGSVSDSSLHSEGQTEAVWLLKRSFILRRLLRLAKPFRAGCFASAKLP